MVIIYYAWNPLYDNRGIAHEIAIEKRWTYFDHVYASQRNGFVMCKVAINLHCQKQIKHQAYSAKVFFRIL